MSSRRLHPATLGTVLSIWAHPDDETYLAAGVMAAATDAGQRVVCAAATAGEHGTDDPTTWPPQRLGQLRRWESAAAMAVLGIDEHLVHDFPDGGLPDLEAAGRAWVAALLDQVEPDTVLTFGPDGMTYHPDHIAVHHWVANEWNARQRPFRLLYTAWTATHLTRFGEMFEAWGMYMSDDRPIGVRDHDTALLIRLDGPALDRKLAALRAMATQTAPLMQLLDAETYAAQVAEEAFVDASTSTPSEGRR